MKNEVQKLLQKDMDRRNFLKHVGVGFAAIIGLTTAVKTLTSLNGAPKKVADSYGSNAYGGSSSPANVSQAPSRKVQG